MRSSLRIVAAMALLGLCSPVLAEGRLKGVVQEGAGGRVILCAPSGIPLLRETAELFTSDIEQLEEAAHALWTAPIEKGGEFDFGPVPDGEFRLIALRWALARGETQDTNDQSDNPESVFNVQGQDVTILGVANVSIEDADASVLLRPLGDAVLHIDSGAPNDETLLIASAEPTGADPILGFAGWGGGFMQQWLAGNRMPDGKTTLRGLPEGDVHLAIFSWDNNPGWGAGSVTLKAGEEVWVEMSFVTTWSDAVHSPPKRLEPLMERLAKLDPQGRRQVMIEAMGDKAEQIMSVRHPLAGMGSLAQLRGQIVEQGEYKGTPALDLFAATGYAQIQAMMERQGREPNPHRGLEVVRRHVN